VSPRASALARAAAVMGVVVALDQVTKQVALSRLYPGEAVNVFFAIDLNLVRNRGVAFGVASEGGVLIIVLIAAALVLLGAYFLRHATRPGMWLPIGAIFGGALGNLADRAREGSVIDFVDPAFWPAFNLADSAIVLGVLGLLYVLEPDPSPAGRPEPG